MIDRSCPAKCCPARQVDYGRGTIHDANNSTFAAISRRGVVTGHYGMRCGSLSDFTYVKLRLAAAYITLVDCAFVDGK